MIRLGEIHLDEFMEFMFCKQCKELWEELEVVIDKMHKAHLLHKKGLEVVKRPKRLSIASDESFQGGLDVDF